MREFSRSLWDSIEMRLDQAVQTSKGPLFAAFDADGTLWDRDAGESLFAYQIEHCDLNLPENPWKHYHELKDPDPRVAYMWLAQICKGHSLTEVRSWAVKTRTSHAPWPVFTSSKQLIDMLYAKGIITFIVTASVKWAVEPIAELVGIPEDRVIGITTAVEAGLVTDSPVMPITWRQGKAEAFLKVTNGVRPVLAAGNTYGDSFLIDLATHVPLAISTQDEHNALFEEEEKLRTEARAKGWLHHHYRG